MRKRNFLLLVQIVSEFAVISLCFPTDAQTLSTLVNEILQFVNDGGEIVESYGKQDEIILVLGDEASGKSSFTSYIANESEYLYATRMGVNSNRRYVILDSRDEINPFDTTRSVVPRLVQDYRLKKVYLDCPPFEGPYSAVSAYFIKNIIDSVKYLKIILTISYESVKANSLDSDFLNLTNRAMELLKGDKFLAAMALIVTQVDNEKNCDTENQVIGNLSDDEIIEREISIFLKRIMDEYGAGGDKKSMAFVNTLLERDNKGIFTRIGLFRRPDRSGPVNNSKALRLSKSRLETIVHDNIKFVKCDENDIVFNTSDMLNTYLNELTRTAQEYIRTCIRYIGDDIRKHYLWREKTSDDVVKLEELFAKGSKLFSAVNEAKSISSFIENLKKIVRTSNILISSKNILSVRRYNDFLNFLYNKPSDLSSRSMRSVVPRSVNDDWRHSMLSVVEYLNSSEIWYNFLILFIERLSAYEVQRDLKTPREPTMDDLRRFYNQSLGSTLPATIDNMKLDKLKLRFLKPIFNVSFYKLIITSSADTLTVRGSFVKWSDVTKLILKNEKIKVVKVFAMDTIFIDVDVDLTGREVKLYILAPTWNFVWDPSFILGGRPGQKNDEAPSKLSHSTDGSPGKPGGPAGHFFGIGSKFIALPSILRIEVSGGKGGPGGGGCCGLDGQNGEDCQPLQPGKWWTKGWHRKPFLRKSKSPDYKRTIQQEGNSIYTHSATTNCTKHLKVLGVKMPVKRIKYHYYCMGTNGKEGGRGGDGGAGGKGGLMGSVELIDMSNRVVFKCSDSSDGCVGVMGSGSAGGYQGTPGISYIATFEEDRTPFALYRRRPGILNHAVKNNHKPSRNTNGIAGKNIKNIEDPRKNEFGNPIRIIVDYKELARQYAMYAEINPLNAPIKNFINLIESDSRVNAYDNTRAFIYDLFALENQFYSSHAKMSTLSSYESLARRILRYADYENGRLSAKDKAILSHVYSAVLSKVSTLKRDRNFLVMDFDRYCKSVLTEIKNLNKLNHIDMINKYRIQYENLMNRKIDEARRFIDETIIPTIDGSFKNTGITIRKLLEENSRYLNETIDKQEELKEVMRQLQNSLVARRALSVMQLGSQFLQFLGPVGAIVGPAAEGISMVAVSLVSPNMEKVNESRAKNLAEIRATLQKNSEWVESKRKKLRNEVEYITREIRETEAKEDVDLKFLTDEVEKHEKKLKELEAQKEGVTPFWILTRVQEEFRIQMNDLLEKKEYELQKRSLKVEKRASYQLRAIRRVKRVLRMAWDITDFINVNNNNNGADSVDKTTIENELDEISGQLSNLREYEMLISNIFTPLCDRVYSEIRNWEKQLRNKSPASLRMSQWNVQYSLKKIKKSLKGMTDGYKTQNVILETVDQIEEGLTMLIDMYNHIQKYHERVELEHYIVNVNSYRVLNALDDPEIDRLNVLMRSNVILNLFDNAMDAFKQSVFPFAHLYFEDIGSLPESLRIENNTDNLVREAISRINNLNEKVRQVSSQLYDLYDNAIMKDVPFTMDESMTPPFYVWDFKANEYVIQKLLTGSVVTLTSHITKTRIDDNAVKFKNLRIRLILTANTGLQPLLDKLLENFIVELTHSGEMYFRCGRQFYFVRCNSMKLTFSYKTNENGEPESTNRIYDRIKDNYYALSPYTTWNMKLVKNKYWNGDIRTLGKFANYPMKVVLEGRGEYVKRDIDNEICNASLSKYYDSTTF